MRIQLIRIMHASRKDSRKVANQSLYVEASLDFRLMKET